MGPSSSTLSDVVAGGANQLHAALECLVVWPSANQRRQERVVNVDDLLWLRVDEVVGKNLHAPREHHEVRFVARRSVPELFHPGLHLAVFRHGYDHIRNVIKVGNCLIVGPIGGDLRDQTGKFAALMTIKQIDQAVVVVRNGAPTEPGASSCRTHPPRAKNIYGSQRDRGRNLSDRTRRASRET